MAEPLKPCAFCASNNIKPIIEKGSVAIRCDECNARGPSSDHADHMDALSKASEYWNIRK